VDWEKTNPNEPKQTQFPKSQNEPKVLFNKGLRKYLPLWSPEKQTQNKPNLAEPKNERNLLYHKAL